MKFFIPSCLLILLLASCSNSSSNTEETAANKEDIKEEHTPSNSNASLNDTTSADILDALYGNFAQSGNYAIVDKDAVPMSELKERAFNWNEETIIASLVYKADLGDGRIVYVVAVKPKEAYECRICAPLLGAGIIKIKEKKYFMGDLKYFDVGGTYGSSPGFKIQKISDYDFALIEQLGDLHMGFSWSGENLFSINNGFTPILNINTYSDNSGACGDEELADSPYGPCFENSTSITYIPNESKMDYYEIHTHQVGTEWDGEKEVLNKLDKKEIYTFVDSVYTLKK